MYWLFSDTQSSRSSRAHLLLYHLINESKSCAEGWRLCHTLGDLFKFNKAESLCGGLYHVKEKQRNTLKVQMSCAGSERVPSPILWTTSTVEAAQMEACQLYKGPMGQYFQLCWLRRSCLNSKKQTRAHKMFTSEQQNNEPWFCIYVCYWK